jgi:hypothetical protein
MIIYKITNIINNKIYIGKALENKDEYMGSGIYIKSAIKKHGIENFKKEILCECKEFNILNMLEIFFIGFYKSNIKEFGYNLTLGGEGGDLLADHPMKKEIYEKIRLANTGKNHFTKRMSKKEYDKYIILKRKVTSGDNHYSKKLSPEDYEKFRQQQSEKSKGKKNIHSKRIKVVGPNNKEYVLFGNFKKIIIDLNNGNCGLYNYLLYMLKTGKSWLKNSGKINTKEKSKYFGWTAQYI